MCKTLLPSKPSRTREGAGFAADPLKLDIKMNGIDFISITKHFGCKSTPISADGKINLKDLGEFCGKRKYELKGCNGFGIEVWWQEDGSFVRIKGSIMYYWQGHNLTYSTNDFAQAINFIGAELQVNLWDAIVDTLEYFAILPVDAQPKDYISHHAAAPKESLTQAVNEKYKGHFTMWQDAGKIDLKMYDADKNARCKQPKSVRQALQDSGQYNFEQYHLKFEARYLRPELLNQLKGVRLADLLNPQWQDRFREDLYLQYQRLVPMKTLVTPTDKKNLTTADYILQELVEGGLNNGSTIEGIKKRLYSRINSTSSAVLTKEDKKARKRRIKALLDRLQEEPESKWDLSKQLEEALKD